MQTIQCNQCLVSLGEVDETKHIGIQIQDKGYIYKIPILYGGDSPLYFCSKECQNEYFEQNYSEETRTKANEIVSDLKKEVPKMVEDTLKATNNFMQQIKRLRNE